MSQTYMNRRRTEGPAPAAPAGAPHVQAPLQSAYSQSLTAGGSAQLDQVMQERVRQHFLGNQIPQAEQEADRLAAQVKDAHTPEEVKNQLGEQLGADFSGVRFHTGGEAQRKADGIGARAYTTGRDVYFGQGGFDPAVAAHELVHTTQQGAVDSGVSTVAAPMGGVQMMPRFLSTIGNGLRQAGRGLLNFGRTGGRMVSNASHWVGNQARAAGRWIGDKARAFGQGVKGLFRSKEDRNLDNLEAATVPSRAGEQQAHLPFTQAQIDNMENTLGGVRSDNTIEERIAPVTGAMRQEVGDYFDSLDNTGFDYGMASEGIQEYRQGSVGVKYNKSTIAATKKLIGMLDSHADRPEMQAMLHDVYSHEMQNPEKMGTMPHSHADMESRFLKNIMSKGMLPVGGEIRKANAAGNDPKREFLQKLQSNTAYLETMYGHMGDENFPEELRDLAAAYGPLREKLLAGGRGRG